MYYGDKRESMVNICNALRNKGWTIYGYKEDQSDSMTDYYSPADWDGIAEKNGFILCVDIKEYNVKSYSGKEVYTYNNDPVFYGEAADKIKKLEMMTQEKGCTVGEEENAKKLIEKIKAAQNEKEEIRENTKTLKYRYPEFMANPNACNWHVEKDGKIYLKGKGAFQFHDLPYLYDVWKGEFTGFKTWNDGTEKTLTEEQKKHVEKFKNFCIKIDNVALGVANMGDGTEETEAEGIEAEQKQGYEKIIVKETKTVLKPVEVTDRKEIKLGDILSFTYHGHYWKVYNETEKTFSYTLLGSARRKFMDLKPQAGNHYYQNKIRLQKDIEEGKIKIYELKEVEETKEIEKWVKIDKSKKNNNTNKTTKDDNKQEDQDTIKNEYIITADIDTRDNSPLWVVKIVNKLSKEEYKKTAEYMNSLKGYYSKFKHGFIFKYDPTNVLNNIIASEEKEEVLTAEEQQAESIIDISMNVLSNLNIEKLWDATPEQKELYKTEFKKAISNIKITGDIINYLTSEGYNSIVDILTDNSEEKDSYQQPEIKDGFIYDCHFKEWNLTIEIIKEHAEVNNIPFINYGEKISFKRITADQTKLMKAISDINGSIFFIDEEISINQDNSEPVEEHNSQENIEGINNIMDDILNKFDTFEVKEADRITAEDKEFCQEQENIYNSLVKVYTDFQEALKPITELSIKHGEKYARQNNSYTYKKDSAYYKSWKNGEIEKTIQEMKAEFIQETCSYFMNKYNVTIDYNKIDKKYDNSVTYENILDEIFIQLDGLTFREKAENEIKNNLIKELEYRQPIVRNNKVSFKDHFIYYDYSFDGKEMYLHYNSRDRLEKLLKGLSLFEDNSLQIRGDMLEFISYNRNKHNADYWLTEFDYSYLNKIQAIKFYKNGKMDIKFKSNQLAEQFVKEYCGVNKKVA